MNFEKLFRMSEYNDTEIEFACEDYEQDLKRVLPNLVPNEKQQITQKMQNVTANMVIQRAKQMAAQKKYDSSRILAMESWNYMLGLSNEQCERLKHLVERKRK